MILIGGHGHGETGVAQMNDIQSGCLLFALIFLGLMAVSIYTATII